MYQQDYLMRLIMQFVVAVRRVLEKPEDDPLSAAASLETAVSQAIDMDAGVLLRLEPESFASVLSVSGADPAVVPYIVHGLWLESFYLARAGSDAAAALRKGQAVALARAFGIEPPATEFHDSAAFFEAAE